ncbi:nicotinate phosphoribosyltransferase [Candidatus Protochlamydia phocaeensis]|uniref:nicotinate phosphoribosyltransferase n=1 Tax=Candidatus Protochlamydia phocaeensis TaxID=1414722 RepID=UPI000838A36F|nr:nicotinate phosphoribosyltransferase [Candidatus Protochlamydia phocaeensis]
MSQTRIPHIYNQSLALLTDLYQLTMSYGYWKQGLDKKEAVFHLFFRKTPFQGGFTIAAGLECLIDFLENFHFDSSDLDYLAKVSGPDGQPYFHEDFLDYLSCLKFSGSIDAVPEGTAVFPYEPLVRVQGPLIECQILESPILNLINFPTLIATKAARICLAAKGEPVMEFGVRRAQGIDGALTASRAAYIGGCESTSNVLAGKLFGIPVKGTHAHSWVMVFDDEMESFKAYAEALPNNCIFLVDTYDSLAGVKKAIEVGKWLKAQGKKMLGIRLDSGDLTDLSIKSRELLNQAGFPDAVIVASNELDELLISELKRQGAQINVWGVGTNLITAKDQPALDGVYKLSAIRNPGEEWKYKLKLSEQMTKVSNPGILQVKRFYTSQENVADVIYNIETPIKGDCRVVDPLDPTKERLIRKGLQSKDLLEPIFRNGERVYQLPTLKEIRERTKKELSCFPMGIKRFINPHLYFVGMEKTLYDLKIHLIKQVREVTPIPSPTP